MRRFRSELMQVTNNLTGKTTYYVKKCDVFSRISREDYDKRYHEADGFECVVSRSTKRHSRSYITAIYEYA